MYLSFFNLTDKPFELLPNPRFLYLSKGHKKALSYLEYGIQERAGFTLLTGEVGSGKTTLLRNIIKNLDSETTLSLVFNTRVAADQLLGMINEDFGLETAGKNKVTLLRELNDFLVEENSKNRRPIVIVDEAQNLSEDSLEEIRLLSNLEFDSFKMMQIILVGQPELKQLLVKPSLRQLRQRINISCHLKALTREETEAYIYHRLEIAGNRNALKFNEGVFDLIHEYSQGGPRLINVICDFILLTNFVEERKEVGEDLVVEAIEELSIEMLNSNNVEAQSGEVTQFCNQIDPSIENRLLRLEKDMALLMKGKTTVEDSLDHGGILEYLTVQHQQQYNQIEEKLRKMNFLIEKLKQLQPEPQILKSES